MIEILILVILWALTCILSCIVGAIISKKLEYKPKARERPEITEAQQRKAERARAEWHNMLTYDGNEQPDIGTDRP
uniref:Uncharacterized protein n=1 Tax=Siphoviridae sp. ctomJ2 TaxID=2827593 RepID=A0A8S5LKB1_9CAUD|nr:MAG TPA: hypothetical protein [Siphoviridae sp. ctomJ2]